MASINLTIPNDKIQRIITAFTSEYGYQATVTDAEGNVTANPETEAAFTKRMVVEHVKQVTKTYEGNLAAGTARKTVETDVATINIT